MTLIIETGAIIPDADTFATVTELRARASDFGPMIPADEAALEALLRRAAEAMAAWNWQGQRVSALQPLCWPRADVPGVGAGVIPMGVKQAQCALAIELHHDDLDPPEKRRGAVTREKVDVLEVEYANVTPTSPRPRASLVLADAFLRPIGATIPTART